MDVSIYHVTRSPIEKLLPRLLEKILESGKRAVLLVNQQEKIDPLSHTLWTYAQQSFLTHGSKKDGRAEHQPIWLTHQLENPNNGDILVILEGGEAPNLDTFSRCLDLYNANDPHALSLAKRRQIQYEENGFKIAHWSQDDSGQWVNQPI